MHAYMKLIEYLSITMRHHNATIVFATMVYTHNIGFKIMHSFKYIIYMGLRNSESIKRGRYVDVTQ